MTNQEMKAAKERCFRDISAALPRYTARMNEMDQRICAYAGDLAGDIDAHNIDELLGLRKFFRILDTYPFDAAKLGTMFRAYETLQFSGLKGRRCYMLTPIQCFMLASTFGPMRSVDDWRRVVTEAVYFIPRKFCKTTMGAFIQFWFFFFEDYNCEGYCVANSSDQAKILYDLTYDLIHQLDPKEQRIRFTATEINWLPGQPRSSKVCALSAGGKTKDGLFAGVATADEYGSAGYVKDKSDMARLLQVVEGSMGPRPEPMTLITTTAGRVNEGPFEIKLRGIQQALLQELDIPLDGRPHRTYLDWNYTMALHPDVWETDDGSLQDPRIWKKVNPHIGITVQPDYYEREWQKMLVDPEKRKEQVTKLFNIFECGAVREWISGDAVRRLQRPVRIDDLGDGWVVFIGQDFSQGDDLCGQSYLCYNQDTGEFFADMDAWVTADTMATNPNAALYAEWHRQGWLHVCDGSTIDESVIVERIIAISEHVTILRIGYDSYDAKRFINGVKAWIFGMGQNPDAYVRPVSQTWASYNGPVQELEYMIKNEPPLIHFSGNPMWGWEFANAYLDEDRMGNKKPIKRSANAKVDNVQCLLSAIKLFDEAEGEIVK